MIVAQLISRIQGKMTALYEIRIENANQLVTGHLNVNSPRNKFDMLEEIIKEKIYIFLISETKPDGSFPSRQFIIKCYSIPLRLDRNQNGRGLFLYVREDIPWKILNEYTPEKPIKNVKNIFVEINLRSRKWLLSCSYNLNTNLLADHVHCIGREIDFYSSNYDNFIVLFILFILYL